MFLATNAICATKVTSRAKRPFLIRALDNTAKVALVLAAVVSRGKSTINRIYHLDRGYENIEKKLRKIGVKIKRLK